MRKIKIILILSIMIFMVLSTRVYGAKLQATISVTPNKTEVQAGDKVTFIMKLENVSNAEGGIVGAIAGKIEYDKNFFESLEYTEITMNEETGKFTRMNGFTNNSVIGTVSLKVKANASGSGKVYFKELLANDGRDDYEQGEASTQDKTITITVRNAGGNTTGGNTTGGNTTGGNTTGGNTAGGNTTGGNTTGGNTAGGNTTGGNTTGGNTAGGNTADGNTAGSNQKIYPKKEIPAEDESKAKSGNLPKTGIKNALIMIIPILAICSLVTYKKYNKYKSL